MIEQVYKLHTENHLNASEDDINELFHNLLTSVSVRAENVLNAWRNSFPSEQDFVSHLMIASLQEIKGLHNCGNTTTKEIIELRDCLNSRFQIKDGNTEVEANPERKDENSSLPKNIDELLPIILSMTTSLSSRSKNRISLLLKECKNSLRVFYDRISMPGSIESIQGIGDKSKPEIKAFFDRAIAFLKQIHDETSVSYIVKRYVMSSPDLSLPEGAFELLSEKEKALGYFPLFAAIQLYLDNCRAEEKTIIDGCFIIYKGQQRTDLKEVASALNLTSERVRQKRNALIEHMPAYFRRYYDLGFINKNPYRYQMIHVEDEVNSAEGTNFNLNFVTWVLGSIFDELSIIGDPIKSICFNSFLSLVPTSLIQLFDFEGFMIDIDNRLQEKRVNDECVKLINVINAHLKVQYCEDELPEIDTTCRSILYLHYPVEVDFGSIILPANAYKTNQVIVEEILRKTGHPMTLEDIVNEYMYEYPERRSNESSIRGAINLNENIVPFGRTSTYALKEWKSADMRGGTIRSFVREYIDSTPGGIALTEDIAKYVIKFRPETNENNIITNILLDPDKTFMFYYCDGKRYFGYSTRQYPEMFFPVEGSAKIAKSNSLYYPKVINFIKESKRFPLLNSESPEEKELYRFWSRQKARYKKKELDNHSLLYYRKIEDEYSRYKNLESNVQDNLG